MARVLLLLFSLAMPMISWFSQRGAFGPTNGAISDQYPTLLVAAGYAFAIWGLIFTLDVILGVVQVTRSDREAPELSGLRLPIAIGFALTAAWMIVFTQELFWLALAIILGALALMLYAALQLSRRGASIRHLGWAWLPVSLHAGWLSLAAFLNIAQVIVAFKIFPVSDMLPWSAALFVLAAGVLLLANRGMRGNWAYVAAAVWGLVGVYVRQSSAALAGASVAAWIALTIAVVLTAQFAWLLTRKTA
jgi:hypothetical protein